MPEVKNVLSALRLLSDPENLQDGRVWLRNLAKGLTPEDIKSAMEGKWDPIPQVFNHWNFGDPRVVKELRFGIRCVWDELEKYLTNVPRIYGEMVAENPELIKVLDTPKGKKVLTWMIRRLYDAFYLYTFPQAEEVEEIPPETREVVFALVPTLRGESGYETEEEAEAPVGEV